jgi:hypothetical protein
MILFELDVGVVRQRRTGRVAQYPPGAAAHARATILDAIGEAKNLINAMKRDALPSNRIPSDPPHLSAAVEGRIHVVAALRQGRRPLAGNILSAATENCPVTAM